MGERRGQYYRHDLGYCGHVYYLRVVQLHSGADGRVRPAKLGYGLAAGYTATIACIPAVATAPVTCTVTINWVENAVAANAQQTNISNLITNVSPSYTLNVEP